MKIPVRTLLIAPGVLLLAAGVLLPAALAVRVSLSGRDPARFDAVAGWTLAHHAEVVAEPAGRALVARTLLVAGLSASVALAVALPLALALAAWRGRAARLGVGLLMLPKLVSVLVVAVGFLWLLGADGPVNRALLTLGAIGEAFPFTNHLIGVVLVEAYLLVPLLTLVLLDARRRIDPTLVPAARGLGASAWAAFRGVTWPLLWPGVRLAWALGFAWGCGAVVGPTFFGRPEDWTLAVEAQRQLFDRLHLQRGAAAAVWLLPAAGCVALLTRGPR